MATEIPENPIPPVEEAVEVPEVAADSPQADTPVEETVEEVAAVDDESPQEDTTEVKAPGDEESQDPVVKEWKDEQAQNAQAKTSLLEGENWKQYSVKVKKTWVHRMFDYISYGTCGVALLMIVAQLIGIYFFYMSPVQAVMRCYVIVMCVVVIMNELDLTQFIRESAILRVWITRGLIYAFIGVLGLEENETEDPEKNSSSLWRDAAFQYFEIAAFIMVANGLLYYAMGCMCIQIVKTRAVQDYETKCADLKQTKKDRKEIAPMA